ncbi:fibronectin type III domain-containing protein [Hymenobacter sp. ASUV-10]|uniref:Fibronectin type III domain-containing protein n=1 Tax=Hymenobacter aranciens TaxID=3063996 RepID=A0ABT9B532_9BACT|nr:fibronectin type III domain-containing protein [Hymenobacter sp. ASUV-10]MDO7873375.1 fibronectin type III domain-containing protein [Hymenobacter sp. ASUV-10]
MSENLLRRNTIQGPPGGGVSLPSTGLARTSRWLVTAAVALLGIGQAQAQVRLYTFGQSSGTYTPITGGTVAAVNVVAAADPYPGPTDDVVTAAATIPFSFTFNGVAYTAVRISSNGFLTFGTTAPTTTNYLPISSTGGYAGAASALGSDLAGNHVAGNLGEIRYETVGSSPNRTFVVQWSNFARVDPTTFLYANDIINFQVRLNETSNTIDFVYNAAAVAAGLTTNPQVGLRGSTNADYNNRNSTTSWASTVAGTANTAGVFLTSTVKPASGLTFTYTPPVPCTAPPTAGTAVATLPNGCGTVSSTLSLTGSAGGSGVTYQWQRSTTGIGGPYTNAPGTSTNFTYSATGITTDTYYQAVVTCSGQSATSTPALVSVYAATPAPYATLPYTEGFESWTGRCGNLEVPGTNWRATPITGNNSWRRNDQGFTTAGWSYLVNDPAPYQTPASQGSYSARFHTFGSNSGTQGSLSLYADLSAAGTKTLTFDYINPTRDNTVERLEVLLSTDGGATFPTTLLTLTTSSSFSGQSVTFPASSATSVIRFRATSDFGSDDIGIDNLRLEVTPACPGVAFAPTTAITSSSATINFAAVGSATSYTVNYSPGGTSQTVGNANPVTLTGLAPYTTYTVTVTTTCGGGPGGTSTTSFRTAIGNDDCAGAVALTPGAAGDPCTGSTYTTTGATASSLVTSPCTGEADDDVWFSFVATGARHSVTVTPTFNFDAALELRSGASCPGASLLCQNASASGGPTGTETMVATGLTTGTRYYVRVYNALTGAGSADFDICVTTPADLPCEEVTNLTTTNITATSATVTFDPSGGALNYSVTATPTTGAAVSTTAAGSPVSLTGLTPGTSYTVRVETTCLNGGASTAAVTTFATVAAVSNDNCATATSLTPGAAGAACASPTLGTTVNSTASAPAACAGDADDDVWYSFVATSTGHTITVVGATGFDAVAELRSGSCAAGTSVTCRDNTGDGGTETIVASGLTVGSTYYVRVHDYFTGVYGGFTICVTTPATPPAAPANDNCATATVLTPGAAGAACGTPTNGTTVNATPSGQAACTGTADDDVWYSFVATATSHVVTVVGGADFDAVVNLRSGTCAASTSVVCRDNTGLAGTETLTATGLTVGSTYYVRVYDYDSGFSDTFTICITTPGAAPANDECAGAVSLTPGAVGAACATPTSGTTVSATASGPAVCSTGATADDDVWYSFVATATSHVVTVTSTLDMVVDLRTGTCAASTNVACRDELFSGAEVLTATGLTVGNTYFVRVYDYDAGNYGAFTICVTTPGAAPANDNCAGAVSLTPGAAGAGCVAATSGTTVSATASGAATACGGTPDDDVWYSFVATATSHTVTVAGGTGFDAVVDLRSGTCAASTNLDCADNTFGGDTENLLATGLTVGSTYYVRVYDWSSGASGTFTICVTTPGTPPANDNCSGATALTVQAGSCTTPTSGTNVDATDSGVADPACSSYLGGDVWYRFVVPAGGAVTVETGQGSGTSVSDTGLALYTGTCASLTEIACDDDAGTGAFSLITATGLTPGATVYARVFAYDNAEIGTFTICVSTPGDLIVSTAQSGSGTYNNVTVQNGGVLSMNGNLTVTGTVTVQSGGTLNTNCTNTILGPANFVLAAGGTLEVCSPIGLVAGSTTGFLRTTGTRSFSNDANYVYDGTQAQVTGAALPARVRNLTVNNIFGLTLSQALSVAQVARLQSGSLATGGNTFTLLSDASGTALVDNSGGGSVTGAGTMQRAITGGVSGPAYRHFSAPVSNTTVNDLNTTGFAPVVNPNYNSAAEPNNVTPFPTVFGYDESRIATVTSTYGAFDKGWFSPANLATAMTPTRGYTVNAPVTATPIDFVGTFNNAAQASGALSRGTDPQAGYHLLGNPYPSPIDWNTVGAAQRPGVDATMYVYQSTGQYTGNFRTYTNGVGSGSPLIDAGSGYFVHVSAAGTPGAVNLTNANRITTWGPQPAFGRGTADTRPQLQLQVAGTTGLADLAYVYFENGATADVDAEYDGVKLPNTTGFNLASLAGGEALAINGLPSLAGTRETVVPLTLATPAAGTYTFTVAGLTNFGTTTVYLRDNLTGAQQQLTAGGTYRFALSTAMAAQRRFALAFRPAGALATAPAFEAGLVSVYPNPAHGKFTVQLPPVAGQREVKASLLNVLGQTVTTRTIALTAAGASAEFETAALAKGVYMLRLTAGAHTVTQRVVVE